MYKFYKITNGHQKSSRCRHGRDRMVVHLLSPYYNNQINGSNKTNSRIPYYLHRYTHVIGN
jgi:hypothetical protein